jgi:hypothetical protein
VLSASAGRWRRTALDMSVPQPGLRVTLMLDETRESRLVSVQRIQKTISHPRWPDSGNASRYCGFWVELRNGLGQTLYRLIMDDPTLRHEGAGPEGSGEPPHRDEAIIPRPGLVSFVVPEIAGAARVVIMASRPPDAPAGPIADFDLPSGG